MLSIGVVVVAGAFVDGTVGGVASSSSQRLSHPCRAFLRGESCKRRGNAGRVPRSRPKRPLVRSPARHRYAPLVSSLRVAAVQCTAGPDRAANLAAATPLVEDASARADVVVLPELFSLHGEEYYRRLEREALDDVVREGRPMVLATGGGIVTSPETYALLRRSTVTVWPRARPEDHWNRVVRQGDRRPMADHPQAMADLRALLVAREPLYATAAHTVDTSTLGVGSVVAAIERSLRVEDQSTAGR